MRVSSSRWVVALATLTVCALAMPARQARADDDAVRTALEANYAKVADAFKNKTLDEALDVMFAMETDDFTTKEKDGKTRNKDEDQAYVKAQVAPLKDANFKVTEYDTKIDTMAVDGDKADLTTTTSMKASYKDKDGTDKEFTDVSKSKETWVKVGDDWKIKSNESLPKADAAPEPAPAA